MTQKHLFIMDPIEKLNLKLDSSLSLARALQELGCQTFMAEIKGLTWLSNQPCAQAVVQPILFDAVAATNVSLGSKETLLLSEFTGIHMRKEPPLDMSYIASTWLLDSAKKFSHIFNKPDILRTFNEKLSILQFPQMIQNACVSSNVEQIKEFIKSKCDGDAIVKPLDLFGGRGIFRLNWNEIKEEQGLKLLQEATQGGQDLRIVQPFDQRIYQGEVRAFAWGGEVHSWSLKKPKEGQFLANTGAGAQVEQYQPSEQLQSQINELSGKLLEKGIYFVGYDIIGDSISEINITSPRLLKAVSDERDYYGSMAKWCFEYCDKTKPESV